MKIAEGMKLIKDGWVKKPKGFRVKYEKLLDSGKVTEYSPDLDDTPLDSDVTTWRYAWKIFKSTCEDSSLDKEKELFNIYVVNENDQPIVYYATGKIEIFNPKQMNNQFYFIV